MGGGAQHAAAISTMPPGMCAVFRNLDPDENEASEIDASNKAREEVIGKLRALNLNVDQFLSSDKKFIFVVIGAPETMLKYEAEAQRAKIRLTKDHGGALCYYSQELDEKKAYGKPMDGFQLFSSAVQLKLIDEVVRSVPYGDDGKQEPIDFDELILEEKVGTCLGSDDYGLGVRIFGVLGRLHRHPLLRADSRRKARGLGPKT